MLRIIKPVLLSFIVLYVAFSGLTNANNIHDPKYRFKEVMGEYELKLFRSIILTNYSCKYAKGKFGLDLYNNNLNNLTEEIIKSFTLYGTKKQKKYILDKALIKERELAYKFADKKGKRFMLSYCLRENHNALHEYPEILESYTLKKIY